MSCLFSNAENDGSIFEGRRLSESREEMQLTAADLCVYCQLESGVHKHNAKLRASNCCDPSQIFTKVALYVVTAVQAYNTAPHNVQN